MLIAIAKSAEIKTKISNFLDRLAHPRSPDHLSVMRLPENEQTFAKTHAVVFAIMGLEKKIKPTSRKYTQKALQP